MTEKEFIHRVMHKPWANRCESFDKMDCMGLVNLYYKNVLGLPCVKIEGYKTNEDIEQLYSNNIKRYWNETRCKARWFNGCYAITKRASTLRGSTILQN